MSKKASRSTKGKRTKLQAFDAALEKTSVPILQWDETEELYLRLVVDENKMDDAWRE